MLSAVVKILALTHLQYHSDSREIDIELLSREVDAQSRRGKANLVIHSDASQASGNDASGTRTFIKQDLQFDPTLTFHEYRMDWMPDRVEFFIDGKITKTMLDNVPSDPGRLFLNHWSNGSPGWSGGPPQADSIMTVLYTKAYFNSSDPGRVAAASQRCAGSSGTVCQIPSDPSTPASDSSASGTITGNSSPSSSPAGNSSPSAAPAGNSSISGGLPRPGRVIFLSADPQNVVGQETYNATYSCDGCPKKSVASGPLRDISFNSSIWYTWLILGVFFLFH
jgi:Glycosyl hydrolases family 16